MADFVRVWKTGKGEKAARITFATPKLLWEVLKAMCGAGPLSIREVARRALKLGNFSRVPPPSRDL